MLKIALDVMGGDAAPDINIDGAYAALSDIRDIRLILLGPKDLVDNKISGWDEMRKSRIDIVDAPSVIGQDEPPVQALLKKKDSSIAIGARLVKEKKADAFISAGSSGAILAAGQLITGRIRGVERTPFTAMVPTLKGFSLFLDCGANMDAKPGWLRQYAIMGSVYMQKICGCKDPVVKLINVGLEDDKGNTLTKEAHALLKSTSGINYQGFIEARDVLQGGADVIVADGFTGNAIIKSIEGTTAVLMSVLKGVFKKNLLTTLGALLVMKPLKNRLKEFDASQHGGASLLGVDGCIIKCHGNSSMKDIRIAIEKTCTYLKEGVNESIKQAFCSVLD